MEIGSWKTKQHYSIVGNATSFYIYDKESGASNWITGNEAFSLYNKLVQLFKKDKREFLTFLKQEFVKYRK